MSWIQTYTNIQFWPLNPRPQDVYIEDIAHSLANVCRFGGHCRKFYSVAQHSCLVALDIKRRGICHCASEARVQHIQLLALLHDAAEAYTADIARPIKPAWPEFVAIESRLLNTILDGLGVAPDVEVYQTIKFCDDTLLATEARDLMGPPPSSWCPLPEPLPEVIVPQSSEVAELEFLAMWRQLRRNCGTPSRS